MLDRFQTISGDARHDLTIKWLQRALDRIRRIAQREGVEEVDALDVARRFRGCPIDWVWLQGCVALEIDEAIRARSATLMLWTSLWNSLIELETLPLEFIYSWSLDVAAEAGEEEIEKEFLEAEILATLGTG